MIKRVIQAGALFVALALLCLGVLSQCSAQISRYAFAPTHGFEPGAPLPPRAYDDAAMWIARPGLARDPAQWLPPGMIHGVTGDAAVFFVHPTSYLSRNHWNAPLTDADSRRRAEVLVAATASAFNSVGPVWVPRYRQAAFGAFLTEGAERQRAMDLAYGDVRAAFATFLTTLPPETPIVLAGHSQGAWIVARLLRDMVRGKPLARRVVAAYAIGWPIVASRAAAETGLPPCSAPDQAGCLAGWISFAEPADPRLLVQAYHPWPETGAATQPADAPLLCVNPLTGTQGGAAPRSANRGTLLPDENDDETERAGPLVPALVPAHCSAQGILLIGSPPEIGLFVLPGNNYHVYDIPLFWANLRADALRRSAAWHQKRDGGTR
ncbi:MULTISPECIES: DUF3089 domain-containing protein [unclassified Novosphingobium]|uniref:DUF3089 domain-containing protein n=1 Tax=unclassified Novosphingobium TaxID=2644732 RepID=UPI0017ABFA19|nr:MULTISPECIES: DUF3089 domain-containing protein [unclassified Novosphingobium]NMN07490.1 hypothetical protein [Novosphingobium sp. SG919]NMN89823.1 hypothetical protein [Novosphingobium sp. SG916]